MKYEVSISDGSMTGASNRTVEIDAKRYSKMFFPSYFLKAHFV